MTAATLTDPPDYPAVRAAFLHAAQTAAAHCDGLPLAAAGPRAEPLAIDVACLGPDDPRRVVLVLSGTHGVEGLAGAMIQRAVLHRRPQLPRGTALCLVHAVNPWGLAHLRRVNENNVDLNRNCLPPGERYAGVAPGYRRLDPLLNPRSPPAPDAFLVRAAALVVRHGLGVLRQTVAQGQYELERGLFFGGRELQEGPRRLFEWLTRRFGATPEMLALDLHTGLGPRGELTLFAERATACTGDDARRLRRHARIVDPQRAGASGGYSVRGDLFAGLRAALPAVRLQGFTAEIGTWNALRLLAALRDENRWHHWGAGTPDHPAKRRLLEAFFPADPSWRRHCEERGVALVEAALGSRG